MNLGENRENEEFLRCCGGPYEKFLCLTLKFAVVIIAIIDIGLGFIGVWTLIIVAGYYEMLQHLSLWMYLRPVLSVVGGFFRMFGLYAMLRADHSKLRYYSVYKIIEFFMLCIFRPLEYVYCEVNDTCGWLYFISVWIGTFISLIYTKTVWSTNVRLRNNETLLVMHGKAVAELLEQRRNFIYQPVYGVPISQTQFSLSMAQA
ncbi:unnamed protein product [Blepharisma stoltei]|uniref:Uncharacterized protein n=1 Tax=Blepharisma stoltei TaxID=1481888 RepID=A0AAU9JXT5_9CILI|nr:unnamed protein product [Blepharisma stoltei]